MIVKLQLKHLHNYPDTFITSNLLHTSASEAAGTILVLSKRNLLRTHVFHRSLLIMSAFVIQTFTNAPTKFLRSCVILYVRYVCAGCSPQRKSAVPEERRPIGRHILLFAQELIKAVGRPLFLASFTTTRHTLLTPHTLLFLSQKQHPQPQPQLQQQTI